jgi:hypothetical protein
MEGGLMPQVEPLDARRDLDREDYLDRRQRRLFVAAWGATLLPLVAFGYLTWQSWELNKQVEAARRKLDAAREELDTVRGQKAAADAELAKVNAALEAQRSSTKHYRDYAGIRIQFYRESDRAVVEKALVNLGFRVDAKLGRSPLINRQPNTIGYGKLVSEEDRQDIAVALITAGFPLKRIAPAVRQPDPKLIQIYASAESDRACGLLTAEQVREGKTCGPRSTSSAGG